jgi:hypothetical protein
MESKQNGVSLVGDWALFHRFLIKFIKTRLFFLLGSASDTSYMFLVWGCRDDICEMPVSALYVADTIYLFPPLSYINFNKPWLLFFLFTYTQAPTSNKIIKFVMDKSYDFHIFQASTDYLA